MIKVLTPQEAAIEQKLRPHKKLIEEIEDLVISNLNKDGIATVNFWEIGLYNLNADQIHAIRLAFECSGWRVEHTLNCTQWTLRLVYYT
jgi:hypothetical protein